MTADICVHCGQPNPPHRWSFVIQGGGYVLGIPIDRVTYVCDDCAPEWAAHPHTDQR
jgi:hypothetical protein